ncbi:beta-galactosidase [Dactylosporangium aurantiacum]|uniref:Beta-galactosidase n=1 Tax=Dactylosporangium aurantiacum TaxID=35754 RepID=A0A9Q9IA92_9ACTN|nr:beta-galactosidase [Dactylosporangium aurantiacum]MDG6101896.1 beta-galactosidase [Dactylosporangium aurantiacum]UWZ52307.1 beta-galactosidase [Dactylosporangium aurantiacum]
MYPPRTGRLCFGADYNPEQWPTDVWREDVALMRDAGVTMATVGVFSWAWLEPSQGRYEFGWLDEVLDLLGDHGIAVDLATATASPPPWLSQAHPEVLPVDQDGRRLSFGSRQAYCPSSPWYRAAALSLVERLAERYREHPALAMWHVNNEYGCHVTHCYCDTSAAAFRDWLTDRYDKDLDALNAAWGTAFWSQRYSDWAQVQPPRATPTFGNPTQELDFRRFSSDALLALFTAERDILHRLTPRIPVTTNFMAGMFDRLDYWRWAPQTDVVSTDHYLTAAEPDNHLGLAYAADLTRSLAGGEWLLMEHSTSAVNWQPRNAAKRPGEMVRNSLSHVARGSQGAMYFQWRASRAGAEKWHSAMLPHAGTDSAVWRDVVALGGHLAALAPVLGSSVDAPVALLHDYQSFWAETHPAQPSDDMVPEAEIRRWHAALLRRGITADLAHPGAPLDRYRAVFVPSLYLISDADAANLAAYAQSGGTVLVGPYSGIVDEHDQVRLGGYPGAFGDLLGVRIEEYFPLLAGESVALDDGTRGTVWTERGRTTGAEILARYADGPLAGAPALTRNGRAWYVGTRLADPDLERLLATVCAEAGVTAPVPDPPPGLEVVRRSAPDGAAYLFLLNHSGEEVGLDLAGTDLLTGAHHDAVRVPGGGVVVLATTDPGRDGAR